MENRLSRIQVGPRERRDFRGAHLSEKKTREREDRGVRFIKKRYRLWSDEVEEKRIKDLRDQAKKFYNELDHSPQTDIPQSIRSVSDTAMRRLRQGVEDEALVGVR